MTSLKLGYASTPGLAPPVIMMIVTTKHFPHLKVKTHGMILLRIFRGHLPPQAITIAQKLLSSDQTDLTRQPKT